MDIFNYYYILEKVKSKEMSLDDVMDVLGDKYRDWYSLVYAPYIQVQESIDRLEFTFKCEIINNPNLLSETVQEVKKCIKLVGEYCAEVVKEFSEEIAWAPEKSWSRIQVTKLSPAEIDRLIGSYAFTKPQLTAAQLEMVKKTIISNATTISIAAKWITAAELAVNKNIGYNKDLIKAMNLKKELAKQQEELNKQSKDLMTWYTTL